MKAVQLISIKAPEVGDEVEIYIDTKLLWKIEELSNLDIDRDGHIKPEAGKPLHMESGSQPLRATWLGTVSDWH